MSDRPTPPDDHADDLPDEPAPGPEGESADNPSAESSPGEDGWAGAVDKPGADRPGADLFVKNLKTMIAPVHDPSRAIKQNNEIPVIKTIASQKEGIPELYNTIIQQLQQEQFSDRKYWLLAEKAWQLIVSKRMHGTSSDGEGPENGRPPLSSCA